MQVIKSVQHIDNPEELVLGWLKEEVKDDLVNKFSKEVVVSERYYNNSVELKAEVVILTIEQLSRLTEKFSREEIIEIQKLGENSGQST